MVSVEASAAAAADARLARPHVSRARWIGFAWAALAVVIFSGWFVVTRFSVTRELQIWDVAALRFGIGAVLLAPAILRRGSRLPKAAWGEGLIFSFFWGIPFVLLVAFGLKLTSAAQAASVAPTLMPVFAGVLAWAFLLSLKGERAGLAMERSLSASSAWSPPVRPYTVGPTPLASAHWPPRRQCGRFTRSSFVVVG